MTNYFEHCELKRAAVEAFTGRSTWDEPFNDFEWAVAEYTLADCAVAFDGNGNLFLAHQEGNVHVHTLDDVIDRTLSLLDIGEHPDDWHDAEIDKHRIATALRAAADRIEQHKRGSHHVHHR